MKRHHEYVIHCLFHFHFFIHPRTKDKTMDDANAITATSSNNNNSLMMKAKLDDITRTKRVGKHKELHPLSAYNIFFQLERKRIMKEQGTLMQNTQPADLEAWQASSQPSGRPLMMP
jgi:hypothetical protein